MDTIKILGLISVMVLPGNFALAQGYQGPASGSVSGGITLNTGDFDNSPKPIDAPQKSDKAQREKKVNLFYIHNIDSAEAFQNVEPVYKSPDVNNVNLIEELNVEGPNASGGCWVPDCNISPGPVDMLAAINTVFWIMDKQGNPLQKINTDDWFADFIGPGLVFDPKSYYDPRSKRFYLLYLYVDSPSKTANYMVCVSDDSTAVGNWNIWSLPANLNGTTNSDTWADFPSMVLSEDALYIAADMIRFQGSPDPIYSKLRAIPISELTQNSPGDLSYTDLWDFRNPKYPGSIIRTLKLVHDYDNTGNAYLTGFHVNTAPQDYIAVFEIVDIFNNSIVNSVTINTSNFQLTPHMQHMGGGYPMQLWHLFYSEMFRRNNTIYVVHSSRDNNNLASIHYMEVDVNTWELSHELMRGKNGFYYGYPDLVVSENGQVAMVFQRSSSNEYPGVFYAAKAAGEDAFGEDILLREGEGDMNLIGCGASSGYIRFCDYTDIMFDPIDPNCIWLMGEYIGADNNWKTRIGKILLDDVTDVHDIQSDDETKRIMQISPNPSRSIARISINLPETSKVSLRIFNNVGQEIDQLADHKLAAGTHKFEYNAVNTPAGIYFIKLRLPEHIETIKMIVTE